MTFKLEQPPTPLNELPQLKQTVFQFSKTDSGSWKFVAGEVTDLNAKPPMVKVRYCVSVASGKLASKWFPLSMLTALLPQTSLPF